MPPTSLEKPETEAHQDQNTPVLTRADHAMVAGILKDNFKQWSPGLTHARYYHYQRWQYALPWARRHLSYWALLNQDEVVSSCKLYQITLKSRSRLYKVAGIGAVFTAERNRGAGWALQLLQKMITRARNHDFDAVMLNSDIDPDYYRRVGFELLSSRDFAIKVTDDYVQKSVKDLERRFTTKRDEYSKIRDVELSDVDTMVWHHARWLAARPWGIVRTEDYWSFKLLREMYLHKNSALAWPKQEIITLNFGRADGGYALFEQGSKSIRVLEVIGSEQTCQSLWILLLKLAQRRKIPLLRGWEGTIPSELKAVHTGERSWSKPMILPLNSDLSKLIDIRPCPLLELDHY